ncbi:D-glycero-beta-D-manno-heptose 1-phosphate adenylyltransferase [Candidatus Sumerlaeota bacterium]|nr:D-glycero-beta-D-manno-heptose 1-phosphate adenylyltransferase [Candidatus Sumerlaeota bacterium]
MRELKNEGKRIVLTNGCFDLIHAGHTRLLSMARGMGDILIAALNTDDSIRRLKGEKRPILDQKQRGLILSSFSSVDYVIFFDEDTPEEIIREMKPDVLVKGGEYAMDEVVGRQKVWDSGGEVTIVTPHAGHSTTNLIKEILNRFVQ